MRFLILCLLLCSMGCASFKDSARDAAKEAVAEMMPAIKDLGRDFADYSSKALTDAGGRLLTQAKSDIPGAITAVLPELKNATAGAVTDTITSRMDDPAKAATFKQTAEDRGLKEAITEYGGGSLALGLLYVLRLLMKAKKETTEAKAQSETKGQAVAAMVSAVELHASAPVKNAVAAFTKNRPEVDKIIRESIPPMPRGPVAAGKAA